mgnify:CR=1 FL=1
MTNCTVSGNTAYLHSGGIRADGSLALVNCTITDNDSDFNNLAGGVWNTNGAATNVTLRNTIVGREASISDSKLDGALLGNHVVLEGYRGAASLGDHSEVTTKG